MKIKSKEFSFRISRTKAVRTNETKKGNGSIINLTI